MDEPLAIALAALVGAVFGLLSSWLVTTTQQRNTVTLKLLDEYFSVRRNIVDSVSDLTNIGLNGGLDRSLRAQYRDKLGKLFYMHYDFLPKVVLDSIVLLQVCLDKPEMGLLTISDGAIVPMEKAKVVDFITECSLTQNAAITAALALNSDNRMMRENQSIKLHARFVLYTLNRFSSVDDLLDLAKKFKKIAKA